MQQQLWIIHMFNLQSQHTASSMPAECVNMEFQYFVFFSQSNLFTCFESYLNVRTLMKALQYVQKYLSI